MARLLGLIGKWHASLVNNSIDTAATEAWRESKNSHDSKPEQSNLAVSVLLNWVFIENTRKFVFAFQLLMLAKERCTII